MNIIDIRHPELVDSETVDAFKHCFKVLNSPPKWF